MNDNSTVSGKMPPEKMPRKRHKFQLSYDEAKLIVNAHAVGIGKRGVSGDSDSAFDRFKSASQPIITEWLSDPESMPLESAEYLAAGGKHDEVLRRLGLFDTVQWRIARPRAQCSSRDSPGLSVDYDTVAYGDHVTSHIERLSDQCAGVFEPPPLSAADSVMTENVSGEAECLGTSTAAPVEEQEDEAFSFDYDAIDFETLESNASRLVQDNNDVKERDATVTFVEVLQNWAVNYKITQAALTGLLMLLRAHKPAVDYSLIPQSGRQLLKVNKNE